MKELILNFFSFGLAVSLERFLSFLLIPLYASVFSVTEFGVIDLVQTFIGVVTIFCFLQLETSLQRFYYEYEGEDKKKFLFSIFSLILSITFLLSLGVAVCADYLSNWLCENQQYAMAIRIAAMQMVFSVLSTLTLILLRFEKKKQIFHFGSTCQISFTDLFCLLLCFCDALWNKWFFSFSINSDSFIVLVFPFFSA